MIKVIGWTGEQDAVDPADPLGPFIRRGAPIAPMGAPIAPMGAGPVGAVVSEVVERTRGDVLATAFVEQWWADEAVLAAWLRDHLPTAEDPFWVTVEHVLRQPSPGSGEVKILGTAYRRPDFTTAAFFAYWRDVHGPLSAAAPGLRGYVVSEVTRRLAGPLAVDGFVEQWWPDAATLTAASASPQVAAAWADVANYALMTGTFWLVREHVVRAPDFPRGSLEDA